MLRKNFDFIAVFLVAGGMLAIQEVPAVTRRVPVALLERTLFNDAVSCKLPVRVVSISRTRRIE